MIEILFFSSVNKPLLILNYIKSHGELMKSYKRLYEMSDEEFERIEK